MSEKLWAAVDRYIDDVLVAPDAALDAALQIIEVDRLREIRGLPGREHLGILQRGILGTRFSLSEARILYELAQADGLTASQLAERTEAVLQLWGARLR